MKINKFSKTIFHLFAYIYIYRAISCTVCPAGYFCPCSSCTPRTCPSDSGKIKKNQSIFFFN